MYFFHVASKQKAFREIIQTALDNADTVWNPHTQKNTVALKKFTTMLLIGFVKAGLILTLVDG